MQCDSPPEPARADDVTLRLRALSDAATRLDAALEQARQCAAAGERYRESVKES
jgi:hypothetical protein